MYINDGCHGTNFNSVPDGCHNHYPECGKPEYVDCVPNGGCDDRHHCNHDDCRFSPVPPPIPPIKVMPGLNTQEQMCYVVNKTNECINRWNYIQADCYQALNKCVGAAVSNGVYYDCDEVKLVNGYSEDDNTPYHYVRIKAVDKAGKPIYMRLKPAYGNTGNNGARQSMQDASFVYSANTIITAIDPANSVWSGPAMVDGCEIEYTKIDPSAGDVVLYGFNRGGCLMCFPPNTTIETMKQCRMVNVIGPGIQILKDGEITTAAQALTTSSSVQAIGYKASCGEKIFFSCGREDETGMQGVNVAKVLQNMGCTTAVITCIMDKYPDTSATPYDGQNESTIPAAVANQTKLGLTGGAMFLGRQLNAPLNWQTPYNQAFWVVSKKPSRGFRNDFTTEVADLTQSLGGNVNNMANVTNTLNSLKVDVDDALQRVTNIEETVESNESRIEVLEVKVNGFEDRINTLETDMTTVQNNITTLTTELQNEITTRTNEIIRVDGRIDSLNTALQQEAQTRNDADARLTDAIANEALARSTQDTKLDTKIDAVQADLEKKIQDIEIGAYSAGEGIIITPDRTISVDTDKFPDSEKVKQLENKVDAIPNYTAGENVTFTVEGGQTKINADLSSVKDLKTQVDTNTDDIAEIKTTDADQDQEIGDLNIKVGANSSDINVLKTKVETLEGEVGKANIEAGNGIDITENENSKTIAVKIDNSLSFNSDGSLHVDIPPAPEGEKVIAGNGILVDKHDGNATVSVDTSVVATNSYVNTKIKDVEGEIEKTNTAVDKLDTRVTQTNDSLNQLNSTVTTIDSNVTEIQNQIADFETGQTELPYVKKSGDTMTGDLTVNANDGNVTVGGTQFPTVKFNNSGNDTTINYSGGGVATINVSGHVDEIALASDKEIDNTVKISGVKDGQAQHDAVNHGQLETVENSVASVANSVSAIEGSVAAITNGSTALPYVRKTGDTISGPLSLVDAAGNVLGQVALTDNGLMLFGGSPTNAGHVTIKPDMVSIDKPLAVNGKVTAADGVSGKDLVTVDQLNAKPSGISQAEADGRYLSLSGGTMTGGILFNTERDGLGNAPIVQPNIYGPMVLQGNGIWWTTHDSTGYTESGRIVGMMDPQLPSDASNKRYVDTKLPLTGGVLTGEIGFNTPFDGNNNKKLLEMYNPGSLIINASQIWWTNGDDSVYGSNGSIVGLRMPIKPTEATNKQYVDSLLSTAVTTSTEVVTFTITNGQPGASPSTASVGMVRIGKMYIGIIQKTMAVNSDMRVEISVNNLVFASITPSTPLTTAISNDKPNTAYIYHSGTGGTISFASCVCILFNY